MTDTQDSAENTAAPVDPTSASPADSLSAQVAALKSEADTTAAELAKHEAAEKAPQKPSLGRIVIVRQTGRDDAPGIITAVREDGTVDVQLFRADHMTHVDHRLAEVGPDAESGAGWRWPPRT
jgi:hypothetical protein